MSLARVLETEVMDTAAEAADYDAMDHRAVNRVFVDDLLAIIGPAIHAGELLDLGTGTALIPIELAGRVAGLKIRAVDLAQHMLVRAAENVARAALQTSIVLEQIDAKGLPYHEGQFAVVMSNSIVHHIPQPSAVIAEAVRVVRPGGWLFFRDLLRPHDREQLQQLVDQYAAGANEHQRQMFADSLHAALTLDEVRAVVGEYGFAPETVQATSDRHWTWAGRKPG
ncbi:MAG: class I SAM-dependent methyltransferase [Planctomycetaceae bacterium]|nr:class I SAM-dependent methyltransferase [Planctomycetaceae bacterium]